MDSNGNETLYVSKEEMNRLIDDDDGADFRVSRQTSVILAETHWCKIILAFVVTVFCCPVLGSIAFGLAGMAEGIKYQNQIRARKLAKTSIYLSVAGIVTGVLMLIIFIIFYVWLIGFISHSMQQLPVSVGNIDKLPNQHYGHRVA